MEPLSCLTAQEWESTFYKLVLLNMWKKMDFVPKNKHPANGWRFEKRKCKIQTKWKESWWWAQWRAVCLTERANHAWGVLENRQRFTATTFWSITLKICRPFFSFQTRFLFPLLLSPLSPMFPLILSACYGCQQVTMCQRRFSATNCFPFLNYWCLSVMSIVSLSMSVCLEKEFSIILPPPFFQLWPASCILPQQSFENILLTRSLTSSPPPSPPCTSRPPSSSCLSCIWLNLGEGLRTMEPGAAQGEEAGWDARLRSVKNTSRQGRNTWTARTSSWPRWCRTGPRTSNTCC